MRIAILRRMFVTHLDGVNNFIFTLAHGLTQIGHEVCILTWSVPYMTAEDNPGKWIWEKFLVKPKVFGLRTPRKADSWARVAFDWFSRGSRFLKELNVDAVIMNGIIPLRFAGRKIAVNHGLYTEHSATSIDKYFAKFLYKDCVRICVSKKVVRDFQEFFHLDSEVILLPFRRDLFKSSSYSDRTDIVLHVGTGARKNLGVSIEAMKELQKKRRVKLVVVGRKDDNVGAQIKKAQLRGVDVEARYDLPRIDLAKLYGQAKAMLMPSKYEGLPYVVLESLASGTPVVVSNQITDEIVTDGYNGFRLNSYNPTDYAKALNALLENDELWARCSRNAIDSCDRFDHIAIARKYAEIMSNC